MEPLLMTLKTAALAARMGKWFTRCEPVARTTQALASAALLAFAATAVPASNPAGAEDKAAAAPTWQGVLSLQLKDDYRCDLEKIVFERDIEVGGNVSKEGRVHCLDGREFDFTRPSEHEKFTIRLCQPTVC